MEDLNEKANFKEIGKLKTATVSLQPFQASSSSNSLVDSLCRFEELKEDMDTLPANIITHTRARYTAKTLPDVSSILEQPGSDIACDICGEDGMAAFEIIDHWADDHDINVHEKNISAKVKDWNRALEEYENSDDFSNETKFITEPYTYSPKKEPTANAPGAATHGQRDRREAELFQNRNARKNRERPVARHIRQYQTTRRGKLGLLRKNIGNCRNVPS